MNCYNLLFSYFQWLIWNDNFFNKISLITLSLFRLLKELSLCHRLWFSDPYSVSSNNLSLKYQRFTPSGCVRLRLENLSFVKNLILLALYILITTNRQVNCLVKTLISYLIWTFSFQPILLRFDWQLNFKILTFHDCGTEQPDF